MKLDLIHACKSQLHIIRLDQPFDLRCVHRRVGIRGRWPDHSLHGSAEGRSKSIGNDTFRGAAAEKPLNRLTQNLAWVITSVGHSLPKMAYQSVQGRDPHEGVQC